MTKVAICRAALQRGILPRPFNTWLDKQLIAQLTDEECRKLINLWLNDPLYSPTQDEFRILKTPTLMAAFIDVLLRIAEPIADAALADDPDETMLQRAREASHKLGFTILRNMPAALRSEYMAQLTPRLYDAYTEASLAVDPQKVAALKRLYYMHLALYAIALSCHNEHYREGKQCDMNDFHEWLFLWPGLSDCKEDWDTCLSETINEERQLDAKHPHCFMMCVPTWLNRLYELHRLARVSMHVRPVYEKLAHAFVELPRDNGIFLTSAEKYISTLPSPWNTLPVSYEESYINYKQLATLYEHQLPLTTKSLYDLVAAGVAFAESHHGETYNAIIARYRKLFYHMLLQALAYETSINEKFTPAPMLHIDTLYTLGLTQPGKEGALNNIVKAYIRAGTFGHFYTDARTYVRLKKYIPEHIALATKYYLERQNYSEIDLTQMAEVACSDDTVDDETKLAILLAIQIQSLEDINTLVKRYMPQYKQPIDRWQALGHFAGILDRYWGNNT